MLCEKGQSAGAAIVLVLVFFSIFFAAGYFLFLKDSFFKPLSCTGLNGKITIEGDLTYREIVAIALAKIEAADCDYLAFVLSQVKNVSASKLFIFRAGEYRSNEESTIHVDPTVNSTAFAAGIIVHEACHAYQKKTGEAYSETDCATTQFNFLSRSGEKSAAESVKRTSDLMPGYRLGGKDVFEEWKANSRAAAGNR